MVHIAQACAARLLHGSQPCFHSDLSKSTCVHAVIWTVNRCNIQFPQFFLGSPGTCTHNVYQALSLLYTKSLRMRLSLILRFGPGRGGGLLHGLEVLKFRNLMSKLPPYTFWLTFLQMSSIVLLFSAKVICTGLLGTRLAMWPLQLLVTIVGPAYILWL